MRLHWNGCGLLLHELCHLIHQFCFGLEDEGIEGLYEQARTSGLYDQTLRRDWAGYIEEDDMGKGGKETMTLLVWPFCDAVC